VGSNPTLSAHRTAVSVAYKENRESVPKCLQKNSLG
jgi:hypothetical protein